MFSINTGVSTYAGMLYMLTPILYMYYANNYCMPAVTSNTPNKF